MLWFKALVNFPMCEMEELKPKQVQRMNGEPGLERTHQVWLKFTRRPRVAVIDVLEGTTSK